MVTVQGPNSGREERLNRMMLTYEKELTRLCCMYLHDASLAQDRAVSMDDLPLPVAPPSVEHLALTMAIMGLKPKYREVVLLHYDQGFTIRQTAAALGVTPPTVVNRLKKAQAELRRALEEGDA